MISVRLVKTRQSFTAVTEVFTIIYLKWMIKTNDIELELLNGKRGSKISTKL